MYNILPVFVYKNITNINPLSANITKWPNTLKQFLGQLPANCLSVFDCFVGLALKGLKSLQMNKVIRLGRFHFLMNFLETESRVLPCEFHKFHSKAPVLESLFDKVAGLKPPALLKKRLRHRYFGVKLAKFSGKLILTKICK